MTDTLATTMEQKAGPIPVWGWAVAAVAGYYVYRRIASANSVATQAAANAPQNYYGSPSGQNYSGVASSPPTTQGVTYKTNQEWGLAAEADLFGHGYSPTLVDAAIRNYVAGMQPTTDELALINAALKDIGPPPETLPPIGDPTGGGGNPSPILNPAPTEVQFAYGSQLQDLENQSGKIVHRWTDVAGHWSSETLTTGAAPGAQIAVTQNQFGTQGRIDYTVANTSGGIIHGWYIPGTGWHKETK